MAGTQYWLACSKLYYTYLGLLFSMVLSTSRGLSDRVGSSIAFMQYAYSMGDSVSAGKLIVCELVHLCDLDIA